MNEQPSYSATPGHRWGTGSASVLRYLMRDLAQKPGTTKAAPQQATAGPQPGRNAGGKAPAGRPRARRDRA